MWSPNLQVPLGNVYKGVALGVFTTGLPGIKKI